MATSGDDVGPRIYESADQAPALGDEVGDERDEVGPRNLKSADQAPALCTNSKIRGPGTCTRRRVRGRARRRARRVGPRSLESADHALALGERDEVGPRNLKFADQAPAVWRRGRRLARRGASGHEKNLCGRERMSQNRTLTTQLLWGKISLVWCGPTTFSSFFHFFKNVFQFFLKNFQKINKIHFFKI